MTLVPSTITAGMRQRAEDDMVHQALLEHGSTVRDDATGNDTAGAWTTVYAGPGRYQPAGTRQAQRAAARGAVITGTVALPLTAALEVGLRCYVTGDDEDGVAFARLMEVTDVIGRGGRRAQQVAGVIDVALDAGPD